MSAERFYNAIPKELHGNDQVTVRYFVYYLVEELKQPSATASQVDKCFRECDMAPPTRTAQILNEGLAGNQPHFVKAQGGGYRLDRFRKEQLAKSLGARKDVVQTSAELRTLETQITDPHTRSFLSEVIVCFEAGANRAAIIMVWVLTMHHFLTYVFEKKLTEFNVALAAQPVGKLTRIVNREDFADIKEGRIIDLCRNAKIITSDVQKILKDGLDARNTAAHPSDVTVARTKAVSVIEDLVGNVLKKF